MSASKRGHVLKNAVGDEGSQAILSAVSDAQTQIQASKAQLAAMKAAQKRVAQVSNNRLNLVKAGAAVVGAGGVIGAIGKGRSAADALSGK